MWLICSCFRPHKLSRHVYEYLLVKQSESKIWTFTHQKYAKTCFRTSAGNFPAGSEIFCECVKRVLPPWYGWFDTMSVHSDDFMIWPKSVGSKWSQAQKFRFFENWDFFRFTSYFFIYVWGSNWTYPGVIKVSTDLLYSQNRFLSDVMWFFKNYYLCLNLIPSTVSKNFSLICIYQCGTKMLYICDFYNCMGKL